MPTTKKKAAHQTNGQRNGALTQERVELLKQQYQVLKTDKARGKFLADLSLAEKHALMVATLDVDLLKERLSLIGLL